METHSTNSDTSAICDLVHQLRTRAFAQQTWPPEDIRLTLPKLLALHAPEGGAELDRAMVLAEALLRVPIIAVAGLNDQGKSSLVASFLSPAGAGRVLRGTNLKKQATFRFTLWLPASWGADLPLRAELDKALASVFGHAPEPLPEDTAAAFEAQNANDSLHIPLVAWDERLDGLEIALLDCPDVQKRPPGAAEGSADQRLAFLKKAGRLCAATIVVAKPQNATTAEFQKVSNALPGNLHIYAFNQARTTPPHELLAELREAITLPQDALCFAAYDYDLTGYKKLSPIWDNNHNIPDGGDGKFPCFFRLTDKAEESQPDSVSEDRSLHHLAKILSPQDLMRDFHRETRQRFADAARAAFRAVEQQIADQEGRMARVIAQVRESCDEALKGDDGQRIILSAAMAGDFSDSIIRCAPWYIKAPLKIKEAVGWAVGKGGKLISRLTPDVVARYGRKILAAEIWMKKFSKGNGTPQPKSVKDVLSDMLLTRWRTSNYEIQKEKIDGAADRIFKRFNDLGLNNLSQEKWDAIAIEFWVAAPKGKAALATALSMVAALGILIWTAVDPLGGSALLGSFLVGKTMVALTVKELFVALGITSVVGGACSVVLQASLEKEFGPMQKARFFKLACDELGLPRPRLKGEPPDTDPPVVVNRDGVCLRIMELRVDSLDKVAVKEMMHQLESL